MTSENIDLVKDVQKCLINNIIDFHEYRQIMLNYSLLSKMFKTLDGYDWLLKAQTNEAKAQFCRIKVWKGLRNNMFGFSRT